MIFSIKLIAFYTEMKEKLCRILGLSSESLEQMYAVWEQLSINLPLSKEERSSFDKILNLLFKDDASALDKKNIESSVEQMVSILLPHIEQQWSTLPEQMRMNFERLADQEDKDRNRIGAEWIIQKTILSMLETNFNLSCTDEFSPDDANGFIVFTKNGSLVLGSPLGSEGERTCQYLRIPSRKEDWPHPFKKTSSLKEMLRKGERAKTPVAYTSKVVHILAVPKKRNRTLVAHYYC